MRTRLEQRRARVLGSVHTMANAIFVRVDGPRCPDPLARPARRQTRRADTRVSKRTGSRRSGPGHRHASTRGLPSISFRSRRGQYRRQDYRRAPKSSALPALTTLPAMPRSSKRLTTPSMMVRPVRQHHFGDAGWRGDAVAALFYSTEQAPDPIPMSSANGFVLVDGASFSSPIAAGAVALAHQYRSPINHNTDPPAGECGARSL